MRNSSLPNGTVTTAGGTAGFEFAFLPKPRITQIVVRTPYEALIVMSIADEAEGHHHIVTHRVQRRPEETP